MALSATGCNKRLGLTILDLPTPIVVDILLQLSDKSILFCKCTCKFLHGIVADPQFAKLYIAKPARSDAYPPMAMVRPIRDSLISRTLYLVHPRLCVIEKSGKTKLETTFKIPLDNFEMLLDSVKLNQSQRGKKRKHCFELDPTNHRFDIVNSCHGFLCLSRKDALVICNPVTGEFVRLMETPRPSYISEYDGVSYALGFSPSANCYKVIRQFGISAKQWSLKCPLTKYVDKFSSYTQIQILGSGSWKNIDNGPYLRDLEKNTYLSGTLNWIYRSSRQFIVATFDFVNEQFGSIPVPFLQ